jgi:hypothetical protein
VRELSPTESLLEQEIKGEPPQQAPTATMAETVTIATTHMDIPPIFMQTDQGAAGQSAPHSSSASRQPCRSHQRSKGSEVEEVHLGAEAIPLEEEEEAIIWGVTQTGQTSLMNHKTPQEKEDALKETPHSVMMAIEPKHASSSKNSNCGGS